MTADWFQALSGGLFILLEPHRLALLWGGVLCGLALGILPGIGGVAGTALLLPFTYSMDAPAAMALLLGLFMVSVLHNIVHLLFGVGILMSRTPSGAKKFLIGSGIISNTPMCTTR